jgi:hypothetical protein
MVKQCRSSSMLGLSAITWNASMPRSACLEAVRQVSLRKFERKEVKSTLSTREARLLTPEFAPSNSRKAFAKAEPAAKAVKVERAKNKSSAYKLVHSLPNGPQGLMYIAHQPLASRPSSRSSISLISRRPLCASPLVSSGSASKCARIRFDSWSSLA